MAASAYMDLFDAICELAGREGREERLMGESFPNMRRAVQDVLIDGEFPYIYLEFPLLGTPACDVIASYRHVDEGCRFVSGGGYGLQPVLDWFAGATRDLRGDLWIELDTSKGMPSRAGVYLQHRERYGLIPGFLEVVGKTERLQAYRELLRRAPEEWLFSYVGAFPHREGDPLRVGGYLLHDECQRCAQDPSRIAAVFDRLGFSAYNDELLARAARMLALAPAAEVQLDLMPDGSVGDTFGLSVSFNRISPHESRACLESGFGAELMAIYEEWGMADARWREIPGAAFARYVPYLRDDGSQGYLAFLVLLCFAKVKFKACELQPAKFYLSCTAGDVEDHTFG